MSTVEKRAGSIGKGRKGNIKHRKPRYKYKYTGLSEWRPKGEKESYLDLREVLQAEVTVNAKPE